MYISQLRTHIRAHTQVPGGYDHNYVLHGMGAQARFVAKANGAASDRPKLAATVADPKSGRTLAVLTTAPGMQFYSEYRLHVQGSIHYRTPVKAYEMVDGESVAHSHCHPGDEWDGSSKKARDLHVHGVSVPIVIVTNVRVIVIRHMCAT